jgi:hypothetical protein
LPPPAARDEGERPPAISLGTRDTSACSHGLADCHRARLLYGCKEIVRSLVLSPTSIGSYDSAAGVYHHAREHGMPCHALRARPPTPPTHPKLRGTNATLLCVAIARHAPTRCRWPAPVANSKASLVSLRAEQEGGWGERRSRWVGGGGGGASPCQALVLGSNLLPCLPMAFTD